MQILKNIIGKGFKGISQKNLDKLYSILSKWEKKDKSGGLDLIVNDKIIEIFNINKDKMKQNLYFINTFGINIPNKFCEEIKKLTQNFVIIK